jgi:hypothetical protein
MDRTTPSPTGRADDDGIVRLQTYEASDVAPPAEYLVGISSAPESIAERGLFGTKQIGLAVDALGGRHADREASGLKAQVDTVKTTIRPSSFSSNRTAEMADAAKLAACTADTRYRAYIDR